MSADVTNFVGDDVFRTIPFNAEVFDIGGDYDNTTYMFTAPFDGKFQFYFCVLTSQITGTGMNNWELQILDSPLTFSMKNENTNPLPAVIPTQNNGSIWGSITQLFDLDMGDTVTPSMSMGTGAPSANVITLDGGTSPYVSVFCGYSVI